jgi:hypothetical protein
MLTGSDDWEWWWASGKTGFDGSCRVRLFFCNYGLCESAAHNYASGGTRVHLPFLRNT